MPLPLAIPFLVGLSEFGTAKRRWDDFSCSKGFWLYALLGTDAYFFDLQESGTTNRAFSDVGVDGSSYCWDTLRNREHSIASGSAQSISGILFLQLEDDSHLVLQRSTQLSLCPQDTSELVFDDSAVQFER